MGRYPGAPESDASGTSVVGRGLTIIGRHCYAYSIELGTTLAPETSPATMLDFSTGDYYIVAEWTVCGSINKDGAHGSGGIDQFYLSYNGQRARILKTDTAEEDSPCTFTTPIIIPPFTAVLCQGTSTLANNNWVISQSIIGRVHATRNE